jgi:D-alanyl-D-alanine carboxypeptidase
MAMRELLYYKSLELNHTWVPTLEEKPVQTNTLVHQYWEAYEWDSYDIDVSVDLYGGGGIACTTSDLANFIDHLFNYEILQDSTVFNLIFTEIPTNDPEPNNYYFGISAYEYQGLKAYGHSGFWGTIVLHFPDIETSIAVFILVSDKSGLNQEIINRTISILTE